MWREEGQNFRGGYQNRKNQYRGIETGLRLMVVDEEGKKRRGY